MSAQHDEDLERKAVSRDVIGMAKGIVMAQQRVTEEQASTSCGGLHGG